MNNQKQLQKEIENIHVLMEKKANKNSVPILQAYKKALNDIRGQMGIIYSKYSTDGKLNVSTMQRYSILAIMEQKLKSMGKNLGNTDVDNTTKILKDIYKESYYRTAYTIDKGVKTAIDFTILRPEFVEHVVNMPLKGEMFSDRIWSNKTKLINTLRDNLEQGMIQGKSIDKLSKDISNTMGSGAYESTRIINTEMARCVNQAQQQIYQDSGVVKQVMWSATLEGNTCEDCAALDGQYFDMDDDSKPDLPDHPNCRCCYIGVIPDWSPQTRHDQETGENIDYITYEDWLSNNSINNN